MAIPVEGFNIEFLYSAFKISVTWSKGTDIKECAGTGFFIFHDDRGYLVTNRHVVDLQWDRPGHSTGHYNKYNGYTLTSLTCRGRPDGRNLREFKLCNPKLVFSDTKTDDVSVIPIANVDYVDGCKDEVEITHYFDSEMLAPENLFNARFDGINISDQITFPVYSEETYNHDDRPVLRMGWIVSDPRHPLNMNEVKGRALITESFSTSGASGAPLFILPKTFNTAAVGGDIMLGYYHNRAYLIGLNAGHFKSPDHKHANLSYAFKSTVIKECLLKASQLEDEKRD